MRCVCVCERPLFLPLFFNSHPHPTYLVALGAFLGRFLQALGGVDFVHGCLDTQVGLQVGDQGVLMNYSCEERTLVVRWRERCANTLCTRD